MLVGVHKAGPIGAREWEDPKVRWIRWGFNYGILLWETVFQSIDSYSLGNMFKGILFVKMYYKLEGSIIFSSSIQIPVTSVIHFRTTVWFSFFLSYFKLLSEQCVAFVVYFYIS